MAKQAQSKNELRQHLREQVTFLKRSSAIYDEGHPDEAKRLATHIRTLVHDTQFSKSLLGLLNLKKLGFVDGGDIPLRENLVPTAGLTALHYRDGEAWWEPKFMISDRPPPNLRSFENWWTRPVLVDDEKVGISRREIVLSLVNKDGGAHVDPELERTYARLTRQNSLGWYVIKEGFDKPIFGVEFASVRQITWELLVTLRDQRRKPKRNPPDHLTLDGPCPCGSGRPFKHCHAPSS